MSFEWRRSNRWNDAGLRRDHTKIYKRVFAVIFHVSKDSIQSNTFGPDRSTSIVDISENTHILMARSCFLITYMRWTFLGLQWLVGQILSQQELEQWNGLGKMMNSSHTPIDWSVPYILQSPPLTSSAQPIWLISMMTTMAHISKPSVIVLNSVGILDNTLGPSHIVLIFWLRYQ